jgi:hypothetical protein
MSPANVENSDARGSTCRALTVYDVSMTAVTVYVSMTAVTVYDVSMTAVTVYDVSMKYPPFQSVDTEYEAHPPSNSVGASFLPVRRTTGA